MKKKFTRFLSVFSLAFVFLGTATACGGTGVTDPSDSTTPSQGVPSETPSGSASGSTNSGTSTTTPSTSDENSDEVTYRIRAVSISGKPLGGIEIELDDKKSDEYLSAYTDANGYASFKLKKGSYMVYPSESDIGYTLDEEFQDADIITDSTGKDLDITIKYVPHLITEKELPEDKLYAEGDLMYDYTFKGYDFSKPIEGSNGYEEATWKLSDLLDDNQLVVLNFWYTTCTWCKTEFPAIEEAYSEYKNKGVKIIGINPGESVNDTVSTVNTFAKSMNLSIMSTINDTTLVSHFGISGYPTSVFIDRYGLIGMVVKGGSDQTEKWRALFSEYTSDNYVPSFNDPNAERELPTTTFPGSDALVSAAVADDYKDKVTFTHRDKDDYLYNWPWEVSTIEGKPGIKPSNTGVNNSFSILYFDAVVPANKALVFDINVSTEDGDILGILVNNKKVTQLSGFTSGFPMQPLYVAGDEDETVTVCLVFSKDKNASLGDDTVVVQNIRCVETSEIDRKFYVIRQAATNFDDATEQYENYITPVYNEKDGYYHVNSADGDLLYAALLDENTNFSNSSIASYLATNPEKFIDSRGSFYNTISDYAQYASNSTFALVSVDAATQGLTPITNELKDALIRLTQTLGKDEDKTNEWLQMCVYVEEYGPGEKIGDPIKGLAPFSAYTATANTNLSVEYTFALIPRGYLFKFVPEKTGIYKIYSKSNVEAEVFCTGGSSNRGTLRDYMAQLMGIGQEDGYGDENNFLEYRYYEAGQTYYISPVFWDVDYVGTLNWRVDFVTDEPRNFYYACSEGLFTSEEDENGNMTGAIISVANINVQYSDVDGYYHPVKNGQIVLDEYIYADFGYITGAFPNNNLTYMIEYSYKYKDENGDVQTALVHCFDFRYDENNNLIPTVDEDGNPIEGAENYVDKTDIARHYLGLANDDPSSPEYGLVKVNAELQALLQQLMDKYTFAGVEGSWLKVCYYRGQLGK